LRSAPISHVTAFLVLHELTAVIPLLGLTAFFHYSNWLPVGVAEWEVVKQGTVRVGRYLRRKGWIEDDRQEDERREGGAEHGKGGDTVVSESTENGVKIVLEFATAWAITKVLLPARIIGCVWATPWFARVAVLPISNLMRKVTGKTGQTAVVKLPAQTSSPAAGTGATGGGAIGAADRIKKPVDQMG